MTPICGGVSLLSFNASSVPYLPEDLSLFLKAYGTYRTCSCIFIPVVRLLYVSFTRLCLNHTRSCLFFRYCTTRPRPQFRVQLRTVTFDPNSTASSKSFIVPHWDFISICGFERLSLIYGRFWEAFLFLERTLMEEAREKLS